MATNDCPVCGGPTALSDQAHNARTYFACVRCGLQDTVAARFNDAVLAWARATWAALQRAEDARLTRLAAAALIGLGPRLVAAGPGAETDNARQAARQARALVAELDRGPDTAAAPAAPPTAVAAGPPPRATRSDPGRCTIVDALEIHGLGTGEIRRQAWPAGRTLEIRAGVVTPAEPLTADDLRATDWWCA